MKYFIVKINSQEPANIKRKDVYLVRAESSADAISVATLEMTDAEKRYVVSYHAHKVRWLHDKMYLYGHDNFGLHDPIGFN